MSSMGVWLLKAGRAFSLPPRFPRTSSALAKAPGAGASEVARRSGHVSEATTHVTCSLSPALGLRGLRGRRVGTAVASLGKGPAFRGAEFSP